MKEPCPPCNGDCNANQGRGFCDAFPPPPPIEYRSNWRERIYILIAFAAAAVGIALNIGGEKK